MDSSLDGSDILTPSRVRSRSRVKPTIPGLVRLASTAFFSTNEVSEEEKRKELLITTQWEDEKFAQKDAAACCVDFNTDMKLGLSSDEAGKRLTQHGPNQLKAEPLPTFFEILLDQFKDLVVILLLIGAIISIVLKEYEAGVAILIIVAFNAYLGVSYEMSANSEMAQLQNQFPPVCEVIRDGQVKEVPTADLVPGDIVILLLGKTVPADIRLTASAGLACTEASLTGEPGGIKKDAAFVTLTPSPKAWQGEEGTAKEEKKEEHLNPPCLVFMGCAVEDGNGRGVVVKTGMQTRLGKIQNQLNMAEQDISPLQKKLDTLGSYLAGASIIIGLVVFLVMFLVNKEKLLNAALVGISLIVAAVPEGLPVCVTMCLANGMRIMATDYKTRITKLKSVETLGSASVICTDKTGTLTKGEMTAVKLWFSGSFYRFTGQGYDPTGQLCPDAAPGHQVVPTEEHKLQAAGKGLGEEGPMYGLPCLIACLCSNAVVQYNTKEQKWEASGNITERPLTVAAYKAGFKSDEVQVKYTRQHENPFSSVRKMMSTLHQLPAGSQESLLFGPPGTVKYISAVKGAPNVVLANCLSMVSVDNASESLNSGQELTLKELTDQDRANILQIIDDFSEQAFRVLAVAYRTFPEMPDTQEGELEGKLTLCGLIASIDPDRPEVTPAIQAAAIAGIRTVMITGDYVKTAKAIAENISILPRNSPQEKAVDCIVLRALGNEEIELMNKIKGGTAGSADRARIKQVRSEIDAIVRTADVYARAKPEDKITIVRSLKRQGNVCSMTGDGVNDAPALKEANIGVAMGITGTDVAKGAASMILLDDNFTSIVGAIRQGRIIYANIQKFVFFLLSTNMAEVFLILISVLIGLPSPLEPIQILWLNLATDGAPAVALAVEEAEPGVMQEGPRPSTEPLLSKLMVVGIFIQVITLTACALAVFILGLSFHTDGSWAAITAVTEHDAALASARTMTIIFIVLAELMRAYSSRSMRYSVFSIGFFHNRRMQQAVALSVVSTIAISLIPRVQDFFGMVMIKGDEWAVLLALCTIPFIVDELTKLVYRWTGFGERPKGVVAVLPGDSSPRDTEQYVAEPSAVVQEP
eukprot:gb/GEZN01000794.1/.p1 GENE.gb/GEZN01000794.1/~~gb/GEZN01000794.1/.p1  ORF type:complete len:1095 (+),score=173.48 gb/GEZN01000794.1/:46-3330(+)